MTTNHSTPAPLPRRQFIKQVGLTAASAAIVSKSFVALGEDAEPSAIPIALVGCGHIHTPSFASLLRKRDTVAVKYVWDHDAARAAKYAKMLEGSQVVDDPKKIWADSAIKAVVICSETNRHHDLVLAAAAAKKHIYAEKPMGISGAESREMADAIEKAQVLFTTGYATRTAAPTLFLKDQVAKGNFGKITRVYASMCHEGSLSGWFDGEYRWMADPKVAGVGGFGDLGTHALDIMMWMLGDVESVAADIKVVTGKYGDCDESGQALLKFKNGVSATLAAGWVDVANPVSLMISGIEGHASVINGAVYFKSAKVEGATGKEPWQKLPAAQATPLDQFIDAICGKPAALVTAREAAARVGVMEAAYQASRSQAWVKPA